MKKSLCISLLNRMGYTKRKVTNAGKVLPHNLGEIQGDYLADIQAEVLMNNIPLELIFNWDRTALNLVYTIWSMDHALSRPKEHTNSTQ